MKHNARSNGNRLKGSAVTVLLSGGIDSTACLAFYLSQKHTTDALFIEYGQASINQELRAAQSISRHYRIQLHRIKVAGVTQKGGGLIVGRNAFLLGLALMEFRRETGLIAIGIHAGTNYADCSRPFVRRMQAIFDCCASGRIRIAAPFLAWSKRDILAFAAGRSVPIHMTYSCERGATQPCGSCLSCSDLEKLDVGQMHKN